MAVGCDLRDLESLEKILKKEMPNYSILFVAEVSITYMPLVDSNALIKWAGTFDNGMNVYHQSLTCELTCNKLGFVYWNSTFLMGRIIHSQEQCWTISTS